MNSFLFAYVATCAVGLPSGEISTEGPCTLRVALEETTASVAFEPLNGPAIVFHGRLLPSGSVVVTRMGPARAEGVCEMPRDGLLTCQAVVRGQTYTFAADFEVDQ